MFLLWTLLNFGASFLGLKPIPCDVQYMRLLNTMGMCVLPYIIHALLRHTRSPQRNHILESFTIATFSPLAFFGVLFYTDVWSTIFVLLCFLQSLKTKYYSSAMVQSLI